MVAAQDYYRPVLEEGELEQLAYTLNYYFSKNNPDEAHRLLAAFIRKQPNRTRLSSLHLLHDVSSAYPDVIKMLDKLLFF